MQEGRPSRTAQRVAMRRAAHQFFDEPRVFDDPLALAIIGEEAAEKVRSNGNEEESSTFALTMRFLMSVRSRFAEDALARAVAQGVRQYVVLGAGLDTFAYRNPYPELTVFEVDFPATQAWKQDRLQIANLAIPSNLTYAPVDFEHQTLADGLAQAGFRANEPAFFSWLGVVPYLTHAAATATLAYIGGLPKGSGVAFDYPIPPERLNFMERIAFEALAQRVAKAGEPFQLFFPPEELAVELSQLGFHEQEDLDGAAINARYFDGRTDKFQLHLGAAHLMCAWV